ncbi:MAG: ATP synthase F1 subunit delta [Clostridiales bacterium]|nr:ATP synthase F1 subunit delta [Clostridiales bacterium]
MAKIENRYANALLELTAENGSPEKDLAQAALVYEALDNPETGAFLADPQIPKREKDALLQKAFSGLIGGHLPGFLQLMVRKNRVGLILPVLSEYMIRQNRRLGRTEAKIVSATPLSPQQIDAISSVIAKQVNMQILTKTAIDPDVIGGFYVLVEGRVFDATIRHKLDGLREYLRKGGSYAHQTG